MPDFNNQTYSSIKREFDQRPTNALLPLDCEDGDLVKFDKDRQIWIPITLIQEMSKTFYVNAISGDDNNDGSETAPFKTISKAISSIAVGGKLNIYLQSDYILDNSVEKIVFDNLEVLIYGNGNNFSIIQSIYDQVFECTGKLLISNFTEVSVNFNYDTGLALIYPNTSTSPYLTSSLFVKFADISALNLNDNVGTAVKNLTAYCDIEFIATTITVSSSNIRVAYLVDKNIRLSVHNTVSLQDSLGNPVAWSDVVDGVVYDTGGVPRNILSNIIF